MLKNIFILLVGIVFFHLADAQYQSGYFITEETDTVKGYIRLAGNYLYYRPSPKEEKEEFEMKEILAYGVNGKTYTKACFDVFAGNFPERKCDYVKALVNGPVNLYRYDASNIYGNYEHLNYYVQRANGPLIRVREARSGFKREMSQFFADAPDLLKEIKKDAYNFTTVKSLVKDYNEWKSGN